MKTCRILSTVLVGIAANVGAEVSEAQMREIYQEVATPCKQGVVLAPEAGKMLDNPNVFRFGDKWYMLFIQFDNKGYETQLAVSDDLLHWTRKGTVLPYGKAGAWDCAQADGGPSLFTSEWGGDNTIRPFAGKYWMTYLGGHLRGYETDPLSIGVAWTDDPSACREWTRFEGNPVLRPSDPDARPFERKTLYKSFVVDDPSRGCGGRFVMYYNAKAQDVKRETIGMAVSDDMCGWRRFGKGPVIENGASNQICISGDPMIQRINGVWTMFYFGFRWDPSVPGAFDTFACSTDLKTWTKWTGEPLVRPARSGEPQFDSVHAHKPWVFKHAGVVYHFYCAVGDRGRVLALATSRPLPR